MQKRWTINKKTKTRHAWAPLFVLLVFLLVASTLIIASSLIKADRLMKQPPLPLPPYATNVLPSFKSVTFRSGKGQITLKG
ncbi:MAG TPA: hypothetical protein VFD19_05050, partial [Clostridia bacterium]|nr:hypothetical protein [Clostridia bacterium]